MKRRERVSAAIAHRDVHPLPWSMDFTEQAYEKLVEASGDPEIGSQIGSCIRSGYYWCWPTEIPGQPGHFLDEFGVKWNRTGVDRDIGVLDELRLRDLSEDYALPQTDTARFRRELESVLAVEDDCFTFMGFGFSMFERSWTLLGMENVLIAMVEEPEALERLYDRICEHLLSLVDIALEYPVDGIHFGDDWGQQRGLIMGPTHWRRFIAPRMERLYGRVRDAGRVVSQHSCGDIRTILDDLVAIGLDVYQTVQPEIYDLDELKRRYRGKLAFWGGVSTQQCLPRMRPAEVQREVVRVMRALGEGGGLIVAPTHAIPGDVPVDNMLAMLEVLQNQSRFL